MAEQIIIENRKMAKISSVKEVKSYTDKEIKLALVDGLLLSVTGEALKIDAFSKDSGALSLSGDICSLRYRKKQENFFKKVLK